MHVPPEGSWVEPIWAWARWLAREKLETNPTYIKPQIASRDWVEQFSWIPCCCLPWHPFPIKSFALSLHVSPQAIHFQELDKSLLSDPWRSLFLAILSEITEWDERQLFFPHETWDMSFGSRKHRRGLIWWLSGKESACQSKRPSFDPWVRKIYCRRKWQPILVFLPEKFHGQRSLADYSSWVELQSQTRLSNWAHSGLLRELKELLKLSHKKPFFGRSFLDIITRWMTLNNRKLTSSGTGKFQQHNSFPSTKKNLSPFHYLHLPLWVKTLLSTNIS